MTTQEFQQLLNELTAGNEVAIVTITRPRVPDVSNDEALQTLAEGDRYVAWGTIPPEHTPDAPDGQIDLGLYANIRVVDRDRAGQLLEARAVRTDDEADDPRIKPGKSLAESRRT